MRLKSPQETRFSATRVQSFDACQRKWAWANLAGFDAPSAAQGLGTRVHKAIERYLKDRVPLDLSSEVGEIALAGYHLWPSDPVGVELDWTAVLAGEQFTGAIDVVSVDPDEIPVVWDHKTTKGFGWALTPETLKENTQACVYAQAIMQLAGTDRCRLRWIYYKTVKPYRAHFVEAEVTQESIRPVIERAAETARKIRSLPQFVHPLDLPPNPLECDAYGGCAHRERCNLTGSDKVLAVMTQAHERHIAMSQTPTFLQNLQAQAAANGAPAPAPQAAPPAQYATAPAPAPAPAMPPLPPGQQWHQDPGTGQWYPVAIAAAPAPAAPTPPAFNPPPQSAAPTAAVQSAPAEAPKRGRKAKPEGRAAFVAAASAFAGALFDAFASDGE